MVAMEPLQRLLPPHERLVELDVHREEARGELLVPAGHESLDPGPGGGGRGHRLHQPVCRDIGPCQREEQVVTQAACAAVPMVGEDDDAQPGRGEPAHVRPEPRVAAAVRNDAPELQVVLDEQAEAVAARGDLGIQADAPLGHEQPERVVCLLHLAARRPRQWRIDWLRVIAGRIGIGEERNPPDQVTDRGEDATHRRERPIPVDRLLEVGPVAPEVAEREAVRRNLLAEIRGRGQGQRTEQPLPDDLAVLQAGHVRDQAPEDPIAKVRVFESRPGRPGERQRPPQEIGEGPEIEALLPVSPGIVRPEAGRHRQEMPNRDRRRVGRRTMEVGELGDVAADRVVE